MSKTKEDFEALRDAITIRVKVIEVLKNLLRQAQKRAEKLDVSLANSLEEEKDDIKEQIREENVNIRIIDKEIDTLYIAGANLTGALRTANTIYPDIKQPYGLEEVKERRIWMDSALGACNVLLDELQMIAVAVYADKNKFTPLCLEIKTLFLKIKKVRQADNRFLD